MFEIPKYFAGTTMATMPQLASVGQVAEGVHPTVAPDVLFPIWVPPPWRDEGTDNKCDVSIFQRSV